LHLLGGLSLNYFCWLLQTTSAPQREKIVEQIPRPNFDDGRSQIAIVRASPFNMLDFRSSITVTSGESC